MDGSATVDSIDGLPLEAAAESVATRRDVDEPDAVQATLRRVAEDGVVSGAAAGDATAHLAKVVATPETRVEVAAGALADARETAAQYADEPVVDRRLDLFETRLAAVRERCEGLGEELSAVVDEDDLYDTAVGIEELEAAAGDVQTAADDLLLDVREFESWLEEPAVRYERLGEDVTLLAEALDGLERTLDAVADGGVDDPGRAWAEAAMRHRTLVLLLSDLRWEFAALERLDGRGTADPDGEREAVQQRVGSLATRLQTVADRLDEVAGRAVEDRHRDRVAALDAVLDEQDPPVSWGEVQQLFERHREAL